MHPLCNNQSTSCSWATFLQKQRHCRDTQRRIGRTLSTSSRMPQVTFRLLSKHHWQANRNEETVHHHSRVRPDRNSEAQVQEALLTQLHERSRHCRVLREDAYRRDCRTMSNPAPTAATAHRLRVAVSDRKYSSFDASGTRSTPRR